MLVGQRHRDHGGDLVPRRTHADAQDARQRRACRSSSSAWARRSAARARRSTPARSFGNVFSSRQEPVGRAAPADGGDRRRGGHGRGLQRARSAARCSRSKCCAERCRSGWCCRRSPPRPSRPRSRRLHPQRADLRDARLRGHASDLPVRRPRGADRRRLGGRLRPADRLGGPGGPSAGAATSRRPRSFSRSGSSRSLSRRCWAMGRTSRRSLFRQPMAPLALLLLLPIRPLCTVGLVASGAPGGLFTPSLAAGRADGQRARLPLAAYVAPQGDLGLFALLGAGAMVAATTQGPVSTLVMMMELTGQARLFALPMLVMHRRRDADGAQHRDPLDLRGAAYRRGGRRAAEAAGGAVLGRAAGSIAATACLEQPPNGKAASLAAFSFVRGVFASDQRAATGFARR